MSGESRSSRTIFLEAVEVVSTAARQQFVDLACGNDASLRADVQRLLDAHGNLNNFMGQPAAGPTEAYIPLECEQVGAMVGRYKLLEQIGEGGMGVIYVAEQTEPVRRRVGVKLIRAERGSSSSILARFEAERQAIALMDHPNIAKLLDAGTTDAGTPYFVMELVKGVPLTDYCDAHRLTVSQRLQLFQQICSAVQHAHQKGIIHRDLKPSNILVESHDGKPVPKVIDFGLAKATSGMQLTEHTLFTGYGTVAGTPLYMAPEQARFDAIDVDTRADIYALGVLLYELLTGTTPIPRETMKKAAFDEVLRLVREQEAPTPSSRISSSDATPNVAANRRAEPMRLGRLVKGELDWIVMKALSKERERRYETAIGFAKDIERFLNHEPVQAGPPSVRYRLKKFVRRNRPQVIAASLVLAALVTGTFGTTLGLVWAIRAEGVAKQRLDDAEAARKKAEQAEDKTLAAYRENTDDAIEQLIGSKQVLGPQEKAYLKKTLVRWQAFATRQGADERSRAIRSEGHYRVAALWQKLGQQVEAQREFQAALEIETKLVEQFPSVPKYQQNLATTHGRLVLHWRSVGDSREALAECKAARELQKKLVKQFPSEPEYQRDLATTQSNLGMLLAELGDSGEAQMEWQAARSIQKKLVEKFPAVLAYQQGLALTHKNLGIVLVALGKEEAARVEYQAARDIVQKLARRMPTEPVYQLDLAGVQMSLGNHFARVGKREEALAEYEAARTIQKSLVEQFPAVPAYHQELANTHVNLGTFLSGLGKREAARVEYEAARNIGKLLVEQFRGVPEHQQYLGIAHNNLAGLLAKMGNSEDALAEYLAARDIGEKLVEQFPAAPAYQSQLATTHNNLGVFFKAVGKTEEALAEYRIACDHSQKLADQFPAMPRYQMDLSVYYRNYAKLICDEGNPHESLKWFDQAVRTAKPVYELAPGDAAAREILRDGHWGRALAYEQLKQPTQAIEDWNQTIELSPPPEHLNFQAIRANTLLHSGKIAEAVAQVAELSNDPRWRAEQWYGFACIAAVASGQIADKRQEYADGAMNLLQMAVQSGFQDVTRIAHDKELDALRDRDDFKKLLTEVEKP